MKFVLNDQIWWAQWRVLNCLRRREVASLYMGVGVLDFGRPKPVPRTKSIHLSEEHLSLALPWHLSKLVYSMNRKRLIFGFSTVAGIAVVSYVVVRLVLNRRLLLFDEIERAEQRPKHGREPIFDYYNLSARRPIAALREILQTWFDSYPALGKKDIQARFRSSISRRCGTF